MLIQFDINQVKINVVSTRKLTNKNKNKNNIIKLHGMNGKINKLVTLKKLLHKLFELVNGRPQIGKHVISCIYLASVGPRSTKDPQRRSKSLKKTSLHIQLFTGIIILFGWLKISIIFCVFYRLQKSIFVWKTLLFFMIWLSATSPNFLSKGQ